MARMQTNSASYFPFDVGYFTDRKIRRLKRECSYAGLLVHLDLLCFVYSDKNGYYTKADENLMFDLSERFDIDDAELKRIMDAIFSIGLFDRGLYNQFGIITSKSVQLRFQEIVKKKASKTPVRVEKNYWLLSEFETRPFIIFNSSAKNIDFSPKNATNKIKEKERKINKIKGEEIKEDCISAAAARLIKEYECYIGKASSNVKSGIEKYLKDGMEELLLSRLIEYACEQGKCSWQYVDAAAKGNMADGVLTLDEYNRSHSKRRPAAKPKVKGINNYIDTNKPDYSDFSNKIIAEMLESEERSVKSE